MKLNLKKISKLFLKKHIVVIGDVMIDKYLEGDVSRISPEAPVPVVEVNKEFSHAGGAANVAKNINGLGGMTTLIGVVGDDKEGHTLSKLFDREIALLLFNHIWPKKDLPDFLGPNKSEFWFLLFIKLLKA